MSFLTTSEFNKKLVEEISSVTEDLHVVSAFCKKDAIKFVDDNIKHVLKNKKLLVRFLPGDIINGATDLDLYEYCKANGWELYIRFDLHAKTYIFDKKRYILGSGNLTSRGLGLNCLGNYELADFSQIEGDDLFKIESLFSSAILMTDELYSLMKMDIVKFPKVSVNEAKALNWDKYISDKFEPDTSVLFTYDFPQVPAPSSEIDEYEFLELSGISDKEKIKQAFRWSKAFTWLCKTINEKDIRECYFGELSAKLHNALINDPKHYRKEVKDLLSNLLGWIEYFDFDFIRVDRPNYSQRVTLLQ